MIVVTGAFGFIASCLVKRLNEEGIRDIIVVDDFYKFKREPNLEKKLIREWIHRDIFLNWFSKSPSVVDFIFHLGARTDTTSDDAAVFDELNLKYSQEIWKICAAHDIPLIYASSAATYGTGEQGFADDHKKISELKPNNLYAQSKQDFDLWVLKQKQQPSFWAGLKFFNVFGPNEYHKGRMASVVWHAWSQIRDTGKVKLFKSHKEGIKDGEQARDFIYILDVLDVMIYLMKKRPASGIYNLGTGEARTFLDLIHALFAALDKKPAIEFIDTPEDIRNSYQYFTQAEMGKLRKAGYKKSFTPLEEGVRKYVVDYLVNGNYY